MKKPNKRSSEITREQLASMLGKLSRGVKKTMTKAAIKQRRKAAKSKRNSAKQEVLKWFPDAFCVHLNDKSGYIVWPMKLCAPRGFEAAAIGLGITAAKAWASVNLENK